MVAFVVARPGTADPEPEALIEPTAGVDTSRITTRAERRKGGWVVNGQKVWITNAQSSDRILLLARTSPRTDQRPLDGMSLFFTD